MSNEESRPGSGSADAVRVERGDLAAATGADWAVLDRATRVWAPGEAFEFLTSLVDGRVDPSKVVFLTGGRGTQMCASADNQPAL